MADFQSEMGMSSYPGPLPQAPPPPATPPAALPAVAPALDLGLATIIIIISGNITFATNLANATIQRR